MTAESEFVSANIHSRQVVVPPHSSESVMIYVDALIQLKNRFSITLRGETDSGLSDALTIESGIIG